MTFNENWGKEDGESRTREYRDWRTVQGLPAVCDADQIEYRMVDGEAVPVAVIELSVADMQSEDHPGGVREGADLSPRFLEAVEAKVAPTRGQGMILRLLAEKLGCPLFVVVYIRGRIERGVWVHRAGRDGWRKLTLEKYRDGLGRMTPRREEP